MPICPCSGDNLKYSKDPFVEEMEKEFFNQFLIISAVLYVHNDAFCLLKQQAYSCLANN